MLWTWGRQPFGVEPLCDRPYAFAHASQRENASHDGGLGVVDAVRDVRARAVRPGHVDIVVTKGATAAVVAGLCLPLHRVVRALTRLLTLEFIRERRHRHQEFVCWAIENPLPIFEVEGYADASGDQLLQCVSCFDGLTSYPVERR